MLTTVIPFHSVLQHLISHLASLVIAVNRDITGQNLRSLSASLQGTNTTWRNSNNVVFTMARGRSSEISGMPHIVIEYYAIDEYVLTVSGLQACISRCLRISGNIRNGIRLYSRKGLRILPPKQVYNEYCIL